jgi:mycothiol synthase
MVRVHLDDLPEIRIPEGYELRTYGQGDDQAWCEIMEGNVGQNWTKEKFVEKMSSDPRFAADSLFFATFDEKPVASACAWVSTLEEKIIGEIHMVAALEDHRGRKLGHLVNVAVLHRLKELGYRTAHLKTDDWRIPAINSYVKIGFEPLNAHIGHAERWDLILEKINATKEGGR